MTTTPRHQHSGVADELSINGSRVWIRGGLVARDHRGANDACASTRLTVDEMIGVGSV
jgi:hypothetical protein